MNKAIKLYPVVIILLFAQTLVAQNRVTIQGKDLFLSGINIAWDKYANDVGDTPIDENKFRQVVVDVRKVGGNSLRWWLSTNGANDPKFDSSTGLVSGVGSETINNVKKVLDICEANGLVVSLCLLSHNYLQDQFGMNVPNNIKMLTTDEGLQAYIDNALIPLVEAVGNHPAIACWEIFNEPEGMVDGNGWAVHADGSGFTMAKVQTVVNRCAGAIKRVNDSLLVSNGAHTFKYTSDVDTFTNYYSDSALIAVGGDTLGTLDFYQAHFYPQHQDDATSPFHHPASYWGLDKPIVVGEFPNAGCVPIEGAFKPSSQLTPEEAFEFLYDNGYAGAMAWSYTSHDGLGAFEEVQPALLNLYTLHSEDLFISDLTEDTTTGNYAMKLSIDNLSGSTNKEWVTKLYIGDLSFNTKLTVDIRVDSVYSGESIDVQFVTQSGSWTWIQASSKVTVPNDGQWFTYEVNLSDFSGIQLNAMKSIILKISQTGTTPYSGIVLVDNLKVDTEVISDFDDKFSLWSAGPEATTITEISSVLVGDGVTAVSRNTETVGAQQGFSFTGSKLSLVSPAQEAGMVQLFSVNGRLVYRQPISQGMKEIMLNHTLSRGIYYLQLQLGGKQVVREITIR